jgi:putative ABC transport system ATP-binding protein
MNMADESGETIIRVEALGKTVPNAGTGLTILDDISFEIGAGEAVAIVGVSGSGKSTLLGLLAGLDTPTGGRVRINGHDLYTLDEDGRAALRARMVGFVFQSFQLLPAMTALENVMLPLELAGSRDARDAGRAMLERVGLGERLGHYPKQLSGGEQQRVAIARAFVTQPALLLADEPTGNLDTVTSAEILELLRRLNDEHGLTIVMVTHEADVAAWAERRVIFRDGLIVAGEDHPLAPEAHR